MRFLLTWSHFCCFKPLKSEFLFRDATFRVRESNRKPGKGVARKIVTEAETFRSRFFDSDHNLIVCFGFFFGREIPVKLSAMLKTACSTFVLLKEFMCQALH